MTEYVKICPQCGQHNAEDLSLCAGCGFFLGTVQAEPLPAETPAEPAPEPPTPESPPAEAPPAEPAPAADAAAPRGLVLECLVNRRTWVVADGQIVGQAHATSRAHVQLTGLPDMKYISREHCRFDEKNGRWQVTALENSLNPTRLNGLELKKGGRARLRDGDELLLATVPFRVRIGGG